MTVPTVASASCVLLERYAAVLASVDPKVAPSGCDVAHLKWMCRTALEQGHTWPVDKLSRWLGFVQGVMAMYGWISVDEEREVSRPLFHAAYRDGGQACPPTVAP
jgi:hypothetical protein